MFAASAFLSRLVLTTGALVLAGCTSVYDVTVTATARDAVPTAATSFAIRDRTPAGPGDLRRQEVASALRTALSSRGLYESPDPARADLVIEIAYGLDPAVVTSSPARPIAHGKPMLPGDLIGAPPAGVTRAVMGYDERIETETSRAKHVSICARRNRAESDADSAASPEPDLWRVQVEIADASRDLRGHLPVLLSAAMGYFGTTTAGPVVVALRAADDAIHFVQRGL
jgi:hypothetical protein